MTTRISHRNTTPAFFGWVAAAAICLIASLERSPLQAQPNYTPQTTLTPIGPPGGGFSGNSFGAAPLSGSLFDPYASPSALQTPGSSFGNGPMAGLGQPLGVSAPTYTPNYAPPSLAGPPTGNPSYPNGSFLGGLFSGSFLSGGQATPAAFPNTGFTNGGFANGAYSGSAAPYTAPPIYNYGAAPAATAPLGGFGPTNTFPPSSYPSSIYPSGSPTTLFPGGLSGGNGSLFPTPGFAGGGGGGFNQGTLFSSGFGAYQFLHGPRLRHMFIGGGNNFDDLGYNQTDVSIGFAFQNFLFSNRPLYVVPSFSLYQFDGPETTPASPYDLPGSAYGAFLDFGWQTDPNQMIGGELGVRVGSYSEFDVFESESIRVLGKGLLSFRLTPSSTLKGGVYYLGQHSRGVLPAGGLLYQPNPYTRLDLFFPEPKIAQYFRTIGTQDVWWYLAGQYDAESWTVRRTSGPSPGSVDRVDLNQIDVMLGLEWGRSDLIRTGQRTGFIEFGISFDRQLDFESQPNELDLGESILVRAGFGY